MSDYTVNTIELDEDHRIRVEVDTDADGDRPNGWDDSVHWHCIRQAGRYQATNTDADPHGDALDAIVEATEGARYARGWRDDRDAAIAKHFARAGMAFQIIDLQSGRDFVGEYVVYAEPELDMDSITGSIETMRQWSDGEVYVIVLEERKHWVLAGEHDEQEDLFTWEQTESVGSVYIDAYDDADVKSYAAWHFGLEGQYGLTENV